MAVMITDKDLILFKYLFECNFLTRNQIKRYIYDSKSYSTRRLWQLNKAEYIKKEKSPLNQSTFIMADQKALDFVRAVPDRLEKMNRNDRFKSYFIKPRLYKLEDEISLGKFHHDSMLNSIRFQFEDYGADYWISDKIIYRKKLYPKIPDGVFNKNKKTYAVELEHTLKAKSRYKSILGRYALEQKLNYILYLTTSDTIYNAMQRKFNPKFISYSKDAYKQFFAARLEDFKRGDLRFYNKTADLVLDMKEVLST